VGLRLSDIAQQVGVSPFHFSRLFTKVVGQPPHAYLTAKRVECAKELLEHSDFTAGEIARRTGYPSQPHFNQVFKDRVGMAPGVYRTLKRGEKRESIFADTGKKRFDRRLSMPAPAGTSVGSIEDLRI
jgi:AraC-like DNA-binding protein